jgi:adenosylcobinamide-GDP ribazoletransferase
MDIDPRLRPQRLAADAAACLGFFTRLPAGRFGLPEVDFANALWAAPVAGAIVGLFGGGAFAIAVWLSLPPSLAAIAALATVLMVTGSLHEDGVADVADAFGGGHTRERKLEILKDSRNGTFAVVALFMTLLARWAAMATLATSGFAFVVLVGAHAASRALLPPFMNMVAPARPTGLAAQIGKVPGNVALTAAGLGILALLPLGFATAFTALICLFVLFIGMKWLTEQQIGGQTGDVLGALQQGGEIVVLFVVAARYSL